MVSYHKTVYERLVNPVLTNVILNKRPCVLETFCNAAVAHGQLPQDCLRKVGESCINYQCDSGYKPNDGVDSFNCTESGEWNQNTSALCVGM